MVCNRPVKLATTSKEGCGLRVDSCTKRQCGPVRVLNDAPKIHSYPFKTCFKLVSADRFSKPCRLVDSAVLREPVSIMKGFPTVITIALAVTLCSNLVYADDLVVTSTETANKEGDAAAPEVAKPSIYSLHVDSNIQFRYAKTVVTSRVANPANVSQEVAFTVTLPESAFIAGFLMEIDGKFYHAYVKEKEEAKQEYDQAVREGRTAAHVAINPRDSNRFTVSVNVEPQKKVTFNLTYEQLLTRKLSAYNHVINIDPGQIVRDLSVRVFIAESSNITTLEVPALRESNEIKETEEKGNDLAIIERPSSTKAVITWTPTPDQQRELNSDGVKGQLVVRYDVDRTSHPEQILVNDGYFVHFFAPSDLPPLSKHVTFVLDISGSMSGRKLEQLKEAMETIVGDLRTGDYFSLVTFASRVQVWDANSVDSPSYDDNDAGSEVPEVAIVPVTPENVAKSKDYVKNLHTLGSTNIEDSLRKAVQVIRLGKTTFQESLNGVDQQIPEPMIIFLTDGQPNVGESRPEELAKIATELNSGIDASIYSLAFGDYADLDFLKKLSLRNSGFARKIYEAADAALQLKDFYREVSSPLLANVTFNYQDNQVDGSSVTKHKFHTLFSGSELVVAGKILSSDISGELIARSPSGMASFPFEPPRIIDILLLPRVRNVSEAGFMERLWAYLTIQQLLDENLVTQPADGNQTSPEKKRALELALKYSFVTPLTSLVVVKPNETSAANAEKIDSSVAQGGGIYGPGGGSGFGGGYHGSGPLLTYSNQYYTTPRFALSTRATFTPQFTSVPEYSTLLPESAQPELTRVPLSNVTWITHGTDDLTVSLPTGSNGTTEVLQVGTNETNEAFSVCSTPESGPGHCRHLPHCALDVFASDVSLFLDYFCRIENYVGVCCPDSLFPPAPPAP